MANIIRAIGSGLVGASIPLFFVRPAPAWGVLTAGIVLWLMACAIYFVSELLKAKGIGHER